LRKKFSSSIAHIKQSSKKFFGEKQQRWSSARCSRARFLIGNDVNSRVGSRAVSNEFFDRRAARSAAFSEQLRANDRCKFARRFVMRRVRQRASARFRDSLSV